MKNNETNVPLFGGTFIGKMKFQSEDSIGTPSVVRNVRILCQMRKSNIYIVYDLGTNKTGKITEEQLVGVEYYPDYKPITTLPKRVTKTTPRRPRANTKK